MRNLKQTLYWVVLLIAFQACGGCQNQKQQQQESRTYEQYQEDLIQANRKNVSLENDRIEDFINQMEWEMKRTGTGLRYEIYEKGSGDTARMGMTATILYEIWLLDSTLVYSSEKSGPKRFRIGEDNVESGLHEAITYLRVGDKARFILPSHLAYGLTGDQVAIPSNTPILYDLELVALQ